MKESISKIISDIFPNNLDYEFSLLGGMTNKNYLVSVNGKRYVLRSPGNMTSALISRENEKNNSELMSLSGFNVHTQYFDATSGIKMTEFLEDSISLTRENVCNDENIRKIAMRLYQLHNSKIIFNNEFNVFEKFNQYMRLLRDKNKFFQYNDNIDEILSFFMKLSSKNINSKLCPCHNDLVPENILLKDKDIFFIDWEYSGMNSYLFDISAFLLRLN